MMHFPKDVEIFLLKCVTSDLHDNRPVPLVLLGGCPFGQHGQRQGISDHDRCQKKQQRPL